MDHMQFAAAPIWTGIRWALLAMSAANAGLGWFCLVRPFAVRTRDLCLVGIDLAALAILGILLFAGQRLIPRSDILRREELATAARWANFGIRICLGISALGTGFTLVRKMVQLTQSRLPGFHSSLEA